MILPVVPTLGLKKGVLAAVGIGGGASGGGGAAAGGGLLAAALPATGATVAKVAIVGALVGGAGVAGEAAINSDAPPRSSPPAVIPDAAANLPRTPLGGTESAAASERPVSAGEQRERARKAKRRKERRRGRARARQKAAQAKHAPQTAGKKAKPPKPVRALRPRAAPAPVRARPVQPPRGPAEPPANTRAVREPRAKVIGERAPMNRARTDEPAP